MENIAANNALDMLQNGTTVAPAQSNPQTTLADVIGAGDPSVAQQNNQAHLANDNPSAPIPEPGYLAGKREKWRAQWDAEHQAEINRLTERTNALMDRVIQREAQDLVSAGEFKSIERATEYLRLKEGISAQPEQSSVQTTPPRDANGRFVSPQAQQVPQPLQQRAQMLVEQANGLYDGTGVDVMEIYNSNPLAKQFVLSGGDFIGVLKQFGPRAQQQSNAPALTRSPNGIGLGEVSVHGMTDEQFNRLNDALSRGKVINMR